MSSFHKMKLSLSNMSLSSVRSKINSCNNLKGDRKQRDDSTCCSDSTSSYYYDDLSINDDVLLIEEEERIILKKKPKIPVLVKETNHGESKKSDPYNSKNFVGYSLWLVPSETTVNKDLSNGSDNSNVVGSSNCHNNSSCSKNSISSDTTEPSISFQSLINDLSDEYDTGKFQPHITLLGGITEFKSKEDIVVKTKQLVQKLGENRDGQYRFEYDSLSSQQKYFKCLYAKIKLTNNAQNMYNTARNVFYGDNYHKYSDGNYMPHLSLLYGDIPQFIKEKQIIPNLERQIKFILSNNDDGKNDSDGENDKNFNNKPSSSSSIPDTPSSTQYIDVDRVQIWCTEGELKDWYLVDTIPL